MTRASRVTRVTRATGVGPAARTARASRAARRSGVAVTTLALVAALASCGDDEPGSDPTEGASSSTGGPPESTAPTDPSESTGPSESTDPSGSTPLGTGTAPADGQSIEPDALSLRLPTGWKIVERSNESLGARPRQYNLDYLDILAIRNDGVTSSLEETLDDYDDTSPRPPQILDPVEVDGVEMFHGSGKVQRSTWVEVFGSDSTDYTVWITFKSAPQLTTAKERRALADSILATVDLVE